MAEVKFAKQYLTLLDSRPAKLESDHVVDAKTYPAHSVYTLPKMPQAMKKRKKLVPGQDLTISVSIKSLRNPRLDVSLPGRTSNTSILDLKQSLSEKAGVPVAKMRLILNKKVCPDSKILKDFVPEGESAVEFNVMVMGGATSAIVHTPTEEAEPAPSAVPQGSSERVGSASDEFWGDLKEYLRQRLRDEQEVKELYGIFREAWENKRKD